MHILKKQNERNIDKCVYTSAEGTEKEREGPAHSLLRIDRVIKYSKQEKIKNS